MFDGTRSGRNGIGAVMGAGEIEATHPAQGLAGQTYVKAACATDFCDPRISSVVWPFPSGAQPGGITT